MAKEIVKKNLPNREVFLFGSSLREKRFGDVDIAVLGEKEKEKLFDLSIAFEESNFPRPVDIVDFDTADQDFQNYVLQKEKKIWISST